MKVLVIGGGGREHALAWKLAQSPRVHKVYVAPGNGGTALDQRIVNVPIGNDVGALADFAESEKIGLTVVGPEATLALGVVAVLLGMAFEKMNVAFMVALAFGVASCANFPVLFMSMYWRGLTTRGALVGGYLGLISSVLFVVFSKSVWVDVLGNASPLFPYTQPALFAMPLAFLGIYVFSKLDNSAEAQAERAAFDDQYVRAQTGVGAAGAAAH